MVASYHAYYCSLIVLPLVILSFGGYTLVVGIRNSTQVCDQPIAELLIALGSFLVAPFIFGCLFAPSIFSSGNGSNDDMVINTGITLGVITMLAYLTTLIIATMLFQSTTKCFAPLLSRAQPLLIGSWVVFGCACLLALSLVLKNTRSRVAAHK